MYRKTKIPTTGFGLVPKTPEFLQQHRPIRPKLSQLTEAQKARMCPTAKGLFGKIPPEAMRDHYKWCAECVSLAEQWELHESKVQAGQSRATTAQDSDTVKTCYRCLETVPRGVKRRMVRILCSVCGKLRLGIEILSEGTKK